MEELINGTISLGILLISSIIGYLLAVYPVYKMYKLANLKNPWIAFIPGIGNMKLYNLANVSMWTILLLVLIALIPLLGALIVGIYSIWLNWKIASNFGLSALGCILCVFFGVFVYWYIALTNKQFVGELKDKYTN